ncbi:MAG: UDP-N-acetylmuramate dehydrogenase [Candidatus Saccharimonadales bacterium]
MQILKNASLAPYTSFESGGPAETLIVCSNYDEAARAVAAHAGEKLWLFGYGCNVLISDNGLPGTAIIFRGGDITKDGNTLIADAGVWWDDLVVFAIEHNLYGLELMSGIPGGVAAAVVGNIAAYGQAVADTLTWVEVFDAKSREIRRVQPSELGLAYRYSNLQAENSHLVILRVAFTLSPTLTHELTYRSALDVAEKEGLDTATLPSRREIILKTRDLAGSLWDYRDASHTNKTAGSFFRNPMVTPEQADRIIAFDETGKSAELIKKMNSVHGGDSLRVSAAHVLLAAGFKRGQTWGDVRLHPQHVLKIENVGNATSQEIYDVAQEIMQTVKTKLGITLVPEVRFVGDFA